jgi:hypothetical protein
MNRKQLKDCRFFFLDSGVIIDLVKTDWSKSPVDVVNRVKWVKKFFETLNDPATFGSKRKIFQVSAITLAEIFHIDNHSDQTVEAIMAALSSEQVEISAFDEFVAAFHNKEFYNILGNKQIQEIKKSVNYPANSYSNIRDRIRKDIMIAASAKMMESCVVLTTDGGFHSLCQQLDIFSHCFTDNASQFVTASNDEKIYDFAY